MTRWITSVRPEVWTAIFTAIYTLVVMLGTGIAVQSLRAIRRIQQAEAVNIFFEDLAKTAEDRRFVYQELPHIPIEQELSLEQKQKVENVINYLNRMGFLIDNKMFPAHLVLSICHTMIIRCYHIIELRVKHQESRIGGRYGRYGLLGAQCQ